MKALTINVPKGVELAVVGDVHEHPKQFTDIVADAAINQNRWLVSLGDVYDKGFGIKTAEEITDTLINLEKNNICYAVKGNHELKVLKKNKEFISSNKYLSWWNSRPIAIVFKFYNGALVTCLHAGVSKNISFDNLNSSIDICYIRELDKDGNMIPLIWTKDDAGNKKLTRKMPGVNWHELYDGKLGYIVAGHNSQKDGIPKYYRYSCNLDSRVYETGKLSCQIFKTDGTLGQLIQTTGTAANPNLNGIE